MSNKTLEVPPAERRMRTGKRRLAVDPARSTVEFSVRTFWGLSTVVGQFERFDGSYRRDGERFFDTLHVRARAHARPRPA